MSQMVVLNLIDFVKKSNNDHPEEDEHSEALHLQNLLRKTLRDESKKRTEYIKYRTYLMLIIDYYPDIVHSIPKKWKKAFSSDEEFMEKAVRRDGSLIGFANSELRRKLAIKSIQENVINLDCFTDEEVQQFGLLSEAAKQEGFTVAVAEELVDVNLLTKTNCLDAVKVDGKACCFIPEEFNDGNILALALVDNPWLITEILEENDTEYVDPSLSCYISLSTGCIAPESFRHLNNSKMGLLKQIVRDHPFAMKHLTHYNIDLTEANMKKLEITAFKYNWESFVMGGWPRNQDVNHYQKLLGYCGEMLYYVKNQTREMALEAVKNNGEAIENVNHGFIEDREIILEAIKTFPFAIQYTTELYEDRDFILECVKENGEVLEYVWEDYGDHRDIVINAVENYGLALEYASDELKEDSQVVLKAVSNNGLAFEFAGTQMKSEEEIIRAAVENCATYLQWISDDGQFDLSVELSNNPFGKELFKQLILDKQPKEMLNEKTCSLLKSDRDFVLNSVRQGSKLAFASSELQDDIDVVQEAIKSNPHSIAFASKRLKENWVLQKRAKDQQEEEYQQWMKYWEERSKVFDVPKPKRLREFEFDNNVDDEIEEDSKKRKYK